MNPGPQRPERCALTKLRYIPQSTSLALDRFGLRGRELLVVVGRGAVRAGLEQGPVLVQTPRRGYAAALACDRCRTPSRCPRCTGPLALTGPSEPPSCRWCATPAAAWTCPECGGHGLRAPVVGDVRTAEETA